jgi:CopG family transcriptional regulator/antitoxin EndoAI
MRTTRVLTISLPLELLRKAEEVARQENRTKSELLREALRSYVETRQVGRLASRQEIFSLIDEIQARAKRTPAPQVRRVVRGAVEAVRREGRRSGA